MCHACECRRRGGETGLKNMRGWAAQKTAYTEREGKRMYMQAITGEMETGGMEDEVEKD